MEPSLFNFNTLSLVLSAPPPLSTRTMYLSSYIQGVTKAQLNYNQLFFVNSTTLSGIKPFKIKLEWDQSLGGESTVIINDVYKFDINTDPLSTFSPLNSALSYYVYTPTQIQYISPNFIYNYIINKFFTFKIIKNFFFSNLI